MEWPPQCRTRSSHTLPWLSLRPRWLTPLKHSLPGALIARQTPARIEHPHLMRRALAPCPQNKVFVALLGSRDETRNEDAGDPTRDKAPRKLPGWRLPTFSRVRCPRPGKVRQRDAMLATTGIGTQIRNVGAINIVAAQNTWIDLERVLSLELLDGRFEAERKIERRHAFRIEPTSVNGSAVAGKRLKRPLRVMRPVTRRLKSQAKPPMAMRSR